MSEDSESVFVSARRLANRVAQRKEAAAVQLLKHLTAAMSAYSVYQDQEIGLLKCMIEIAEAESLIAVSTVSTSQATAIGRSV